MNPTRLMTTTEAIDPVFMFIFGACLLLLVGITAAMLYFVVRYHRSRAPQPTSTADNNLWLEIVWTVLPTILVMAMFWYGWKGYLTLRTVPPGCPAGNRHRPHVVMELQLFQRRNQPQTVSCRSANRYGSSWSRPM